MKPTILENGDIIQVTATPDGMKTVRKRLLRVFWRLRNADGYRMATHRIEPTWDKNKAERYTTRDDALDYREYMREPCHGSPVLGLKLVAVLVYGVRRMK